MAIKEIIPDESGQSMVEYGLILALISVVAVGTLVLLGPKISSLFEHAKEELAQAAP